MTVGNIIVLGNDRNKKGDLFNRLVFDVFHVLGFKDPQFNIHKPGREIDIAVRHRTEHKMAIVESKAHKEKVGGNEINKFVGVVETEIRKHRKDGLSAVGYFVSKSGFTAPAIEQEKERVQNRQDGDSEIILLGPKEITKELVNGNVLCSAEKAVSVVRIPDGLSLSLCNKIDLLACDYGWIWILYYSLCPNQVATHFCFVHADGNRLLNSMAKKILEIEDRHFIGLTYLFAPDDMEEAKERKREARIAYFDYLDRELGDIQFEGFPADKDAGSVKVNLENLFVPLKFISSDHQNDDDCAIDSVLTNSRRAAILARPGGGKSTLIRRIALAYAFPERRIKVNDDIPDLNLFPVYIRCRDIGSQITESITEIIYRIIYRAEKPQLSYGFRALIEDELQNGSMVLLIDGLDEISNDRERICFVEQLRLFLATYPSVHLVVTSRETGFKTVAREIKNYCDEYSIAELDDAQIKQLCFNWHNAILNDEKHALEEAEKVYDIIIGDDRIKAIAINPLLLTTLLFVKRWVGYLPTKRCTLYGEMIKLLLVTWNSAAHDRLDLDETEPQLAFVAHYMTSRGQQTITRDNLEKCIIKARKELSDILAYTKVSPSKFIDQVEERSSLLIQKGLEENEKGELVPSYEFSHLSFQEYLTAKALVETWLPADAEQDVVSVLKRHLNDNQWFEVIPLATVLSGRKGAKGIIQYLLEKAEKKGTEQNYYFAAFHLANCVANEVFISKDDLEKAIILCVENRRLIKRMSQSSGRSKFDVFDTFLNGKYASQYETTVENVLFGEIDFEQYASFSYAWIDFYTKKNHDVLNLEYIAILLNSEIREQRITGALLAMRFSYLLFNRRIEICNLTMKHNLLLNVFSSLSSMIEGDDDLSVFSSACCVVWSGNNRSNIIPEELVSEIANKIITKWINPESPNTIMRMLSWALYSIVNTNANINDSPELRDTVRTKLKSRNNEADLPAALQIGILLEMISKDEVINIITANNEKYFRDMFIHSRFLRDCGFGDFLASL